METLNNYRTIYLKFKHLDYIAYFIAADDTKISPPLGEGEDRKHNIFTYFFRGFNDDFNKLVLSHCSEWYIPINPRRLRRLFTDESDFTSYKADNYGISIKYSAREYLIDGSVIEGKSTVGFYPSSKGQNLKELYVYADCIDLITNVLSIINRNLSREGVLSKLYAAIPTVNEQLTDETVITPDLTTVTQDNFNPISSTSPANKVTTTITQKGTQTTTTKRALSVTAKQQADIIRNLPNIYTDCVNEIKKLLIDPRCIHDMCDWGLCHNDYVEEDY